MPSAAIIEPPAPKAPAQIDDFRRTLFPTDGLGGASSSASSARLPDLPSDVPQEVKDAMEAFRKAAEADVKPSFEVSPSSHHAWCFCAVRYAGWVEGLIHTFDRAVLGS